MFFNSITIHKRYFNAAIDSIDSIGKQQTLNVKIGNKTMQTFYTLRLQIILPSVIVM